VADLSPLGVLDWQDQRWLVDFNPQTQDLTSMALNPWIPDQPSADISLDQCLPKVEQCDDLDHDCNGVPRGGLCCANRSNQTTFDVNSFTFDEWQVGPSSDGIWVAGIENIRSGLNQLTLLKGVLPSQLNSLETDLTWVDIDRILFFETWGDLVVMIGENGNGVLELLWNFKPFQSPYPITPRLPLPCSDPKAMHILSPSYLTRIYCSQGAYDLDPDTGETTPVPYPEGGDVQWITQWNPENLPLAQRVYLVAVGETSELRIWVDQGPEGIGFSENIDLFPPSTLAQFKEVDRLFPFHLPPASTGWSTRQDEDGMLEIWLDHTGWHPLTLIDLIWSSDLNSATPFALSVSYTSDPTFLESQAGRLSIDVHHLGTDASFSPTPLSFVDDTFFMGAKIGVYWDDSTFGKSVAVWSSGALELIPIGCEE
jgi:hypothetical protein